MDNQPFLTIVTRCCRRPALLANCIESVKRQTCQDIEIVFIPDLTRKRHKMGNVLWANQQFAKNVHRVDGLYTFMLDDDGELVSPNFVETAMDYALDNGFPDALLVRSQSPGKDGKPSFLPTDEVWAVDWTAGDRPTKWAGHGYNSLARSHIWCGLMPLTYSKAARGGDWHYHTALMTRKGARIVKVDAPGVFSARSVQRGRGVCPPAPPSWWTDTVERFGIRNVNDEGDSSWVAKVLTNREEDWRLQLWLQ